MGLVLALPSSTRAQNEEAMTKPGSQPRQFSAPPRVIPGDRQVNSVPTTIVTNPARASKVGGVPLFQVDPFWPKPLPNN
jgi:hypothetical protein